MNYFYLFAEFVLVFGGPLLVFGVSFAMWRYWGRRSKSGFVRKLTLLFMGGSGAVLLLMVTFFSALLTGGMSSTGGGGGYEKSEVVCMNEVQRLMPRCGVMVLNQDIKRIENSQDEASAWFVPVLCTPYDDITPIPPSLPVLRDEFMQDVDVMFRRCSYVFSCEAREKLTGKWERVVRKLSLDRESYKIRNNDYEYCKDIKYHSSG